MTPTTTALPVPSARSVVVLRPLGWSPSPPGTSDRFGIGASWLPTLSNDPTTGARTFAASPRSDADEVIRLRDRIQETSGLTRAEIARSIGVDRRSLSGFATGEIRPIESRLRALRAVGDAADWASTRYGARAAAVLRADAGGVPPLDLLAKGQTDVIEAMRNAARRLGLVATGTVTITRRSPSRQPLYQMAKRAWAGQLDQPTAGGQVRDPSTYEQDLSNVPIPPPPPPRPTRRGL